MRSAVLILVGCSMLSGCVGPLVAIDDPIAKPLTKEVELVVGPIDGATVIGAVEGYSCKNKIWDAPATNEDAGKQLKIRAEALGANAVSNVTYVNSGTTLVPNCWASVKATGVAVRK